MNSPKLILPALTLAALLGGCVGTGPNTQRGAVTGGALGALAGAIIGNNSGHGNGASGAAVGALAGAVLGGTIGNANDHQDGTVYDEPQPQYHRRARRYTRIEEVPPPPPAQPAPPEVAEKITPSPSPEAVWIPGYWDFNGNAYAWTPGHWEIPPPNSRSYVASHWEVRANTNVFVRGSWQ